MSLEGAYFHNGRGWATETPALERAFLVATVRGYETRGFQLIATSVLDSTESYTLVLQTKLDKNS